MSRLVQTIKKDTPQTAAGRTPSWEDNVADASPRRSRYFDTLRTDAFVNQTIGENHLEFWVALRVDAQADKWRVMHYKLFDMDQDDGKFVSERVLKDDVAFIEAVGHLSRLEYVAGKMLMHSATDMAKDYPAAKFPELRVHYYDLEHYKNAANIEGIAFDQHNDPYRRVEGRIFSDATFRRNEVARSIMAVEQPKDVAINRMEPGLLSDIFATSSVRSATLDGIIRMGECLNAMDDFATDIAALYHSAQFMLGQKASLAAVEGLDAETAKRVAKAAGSKACMSYDDIFETLVPAAEKRLDHAEKTGVHVEPFRKFLAECEVYVHMLNASIQLPKLEKSFVSASSADISLITEIKSSCMSAQEKFIKLGGSEEQMDQIKAWIANPGKSDVPAWLPGFLTRYYTSRSKVMAQVQARNAQMRDVALLSTQIKPPLTDVPDTGIEAPAAKKATTAPKTA